MRKNLQIDSCAKLNLYFFFNEKRRIFCQNCYERCAYKKIWLKGIVAVSLLSKWIVVGGSYPVGESSSSLFIVLIVSSSDKQLCRADYFIMQTIWRVTNKSTA